MNYWFDAFTGRTWDEFRNAGATVSGFNKRFHNSTVLQNLERRKFFVR